MRKIFLFVLSILLPAASLPAQSQPQLDSEESAFLGLINNYRVQNGVTPLALSPALTASSKWMSGDMASKNYFSHTDSLGRDPGTRLAAFGYTFFPWGENIAAGNSSAQNTLNQFINACDPDSSGACTYGHRNNMLNGSFKVIGIGRAAGGTYGWYWTTDFGGVVDQQPSGSPPVISSFTAAPVAISVGQTATLSWNVSGATGISIDNGIGDVTRTNSIGISPGQTTTYTLTASGAAGSVSASATVTVTSPSPGDTQPPTTPTLLSAVAAGPAQINLAWSISTDNVGVTGYQVVRNGSVLVAVSASVHSWVDTGVATATLYNYSVRAFDAAGNYSPVSNSIQVSTPSVPVTSGCPPPATGAFTGCYYSNTTLSGTPALVRTDSQINFDWGDASPDPSVTRTFSARWQGNFNFSQATYTFSAITSDGMRIYIDGDLALDRWRDQPVYSYIVRRDLSAGTHLITVEYYEQTGSPTAHVTWLGSGVPVSQPPVISSFSATPSLITAGQTATLSWSVSGATSVSIDNGVGDVTGSTSRTVSPPFTTTYKLTASNSTASQTALVTVTVNAPVGDTQPPTVPSINSATARNSGTVDLTWTASTDNVAVAGYQIFRGGSVVASVGLSVLSWTDTGVTANTTYSFQVKAFDAAGNYSGASAAARVTTPAAPAPSGCLTPAIQAFTGCYYSNVDLTGTPVLVRTDSQINFDWGTGSPDPSVPASGYSVRWQGSFNFDAAPYTFSATTSDGMRIFIDGVAVMDRWRDQPPNMYRIQQTLTLGTHLVVVEYYEETGSPTAHVSWQKNP